MPKKKKGKANDKANDKVNDKANDTSSKTEATEDTGEMGSYKLTNLIKSSKKQEYTILHTTLKVLLLIGVFSLVFIDTSLLLDKVIETLK